MRVAMGVEYDGTNYVGWQLQDNGASVQAVVEDALSQVADEPVRVICAGRTDTGVHAINYIAHFDSAMPLDKWFILIQMRNETNDPGCLAPILIYQKTSPLFGLKQSMTNFMPDFLPNYAATVM